MTIILERNLCCDLNETISREWLITNGVGGYAAGTVAGVLTRMQHGLLVAQVDDAREPHLLLAKIDEEVIFDERTYYLGTNEYRDGTMNPCGFAHLQQFHLEEGFPVFTYRLGGIDGIMLEKRIWMQEGYNSTYIQYRVLRTTTTDESGYRRSGITGALSNVNSRSLESHEPTLQTNNTVTLTLLPLTAYRLHDVSQYGSNDWHFQVQQHPFQPTLVGSDTEKEIHSLVLPNGVIGCTLRAWHDAPPYHLLAVSRPESQTTFIPTNVWYWNFLRRRDAAAGRQAIDDLYLPGVIRATLWPDDDATLTIIVSTEELATQPLHMSQLYSSYRHSLEKQRSLPPYTLQPNRQPGNGGAAQGHLLSVLPLATHSTSQSAGAEYLTHLLRASKQFLVRRTRPIHHLYQHQATHSSIDYTGDSDILFGKAETYPLLLSDYYSMEARTRETLIALPGLTLVTGRYSEARQILCELADHFKQGMLPEQLPVPDNAVAQDIYKSVDIPLWYCYALDAYLCATQDYELLDEVYFSLTDIVNWYTQGTYAGIKVDVNDGLLSTESKTSTWMNVMLEGEAVTPRAGKPVEVNALWYHALSLLAEWSQRLYHVKRLRQPTLLYTELLTRCKESFQQRFWRAHETGGGYLLDVVDGPNGDNASIRPNQLLALSLRHPVLAEPYQKHVLETVTQHLLTPYGLRTLSPYDAAYQGQPGEYQYEQQQAYHKGSVWAWWMGPYIDALLVTGNTNMQSVPDAELPASSNTYLNQEYLWCKGLQLLTVFHQHLNKQLLGMLGSTYSGNAPYTPGEPLASAICTGELLRAYDRLMQIQATQSRHIMA